MFYGSFMEYVVGFQSIMLFIFDLTAENLSMANTLAPSTNRPRNSTYRSYLFMKELKAAKMIAMVVGFFVLCVVPIVLVDIAEIACGYPCTPSSLVTPAVYLSYMNPAVNILAYATISSEYRKAYKRILLGILCCKRKTQ